MRYILLAVAFFALSFQAVASPRGLPVFFDGEEYRSKLKSVSASGDKVQEYVRKKETVSNWTKLVAFRYQHLPGIDNDPAKAATEMAHLVKSSNPKAGFSIIRGRKEAIIDFVTWPRHRKYVEFGVVRFAKSTDGNGVVSVKFGYRFSDTTPEGIERFKKQREVWVQKIAGFDIGRVHASLAD